MVLKNKDLVHILQVLEPEEYVNLDIPEDINARMGMVSAILCRLSYFVINEVKIKDRNICYLQLTADGNEDGKNITLQGSDAQVVLEKKNPELYAKIFDFMKQ